MKPVDSELLIELRKAAEEVQANGQAAIEVDRLLAYLHDFESRAGEVSAQQAHQRNLALEDHKAGLLRGLEDHKAGHLKALEDHKVSQARSLEEFKATTTFTAQGGIEMMRAVLETGATAIRGATLINAGAAAAVLAFIGAAVRSSDLARVASWSSSLGQAWLWFMVGLGAAAGAACFRYLSQFSFTLGFPAAVKREPSKWRWAGYVFQAVAMLLVATSFTLYFAGSIGVAQVFGALPK